VQSPEFESGAWRTRGDALLALGRHEAAAASFERAEALAQAIGHGGRHEALAGRARVASSRGDFATALAHVETLLARRASDERWDGADERSVLWICHQVLAQAGDARAAALLADAQAEVQARAATIATLRCAQPANVPHHTRRRRLGGGSAIGSAARRYCRRAAISHPPRRACLPSLRAPAVR
jgi:tetratricopeptide (TPR) repeat protein